MSDMVLFTAHRYGHTHSTGGFSGAFSWWRSAIENNGRFAWCCHEQGFGSSVNYCVTDDFGNLVAVAS